MTIENPNNNEESNNNRNYTNSVIEEVDAVISETYEIINKKTEEKELNPTQKIIELENLKWKVKKTIIRLGWHDISDMPNDYPGAPLAIMFVIMYDFIKSLANEDLSKLWNRVDNINNLIRVLKEKEDLWI